jgi:hypothetical protein
MTTVYDEILRTVGFAPHQIRPQGLTRFATSSRPSNRDGWVRVMQDGIVRFGCWRQGVTGWWRDGAGNHRSVTKDDYAIKLALAEQEKRNQRQSRINAQVFDCANQLRRQSPVGQYLVHRGLGALTTSPQALRMSVLPHFDDGVEIGRYPVMLGAVTTPEGVLVGLHRTYISEIGKKAPVPCPKKLSRTSGHLSGASVKLFNPVVIDGRLALGVAEGIETALACYLASGIPTWSCVSASGIKSFQWPDGLQSLVVFADNDASGVGQSAARELTGRAAAAGLECRVLVPEVVGSDWLDVYAAGGAAQ